MVGSRLLQLLQPKPSAATFLGTPGEGYKLVNYTFLQLVLGTIVGRIIVAFLFIKPFYDLKVYSIYEFLEWRFGKKTRQAASAIFLNHSHALASGARLYVAAIVLAVGFSLITGKSAESHRTTDDLRWFYRADNNCYRNLHINWWYQSSNLDRLYTIVGHVCRRYRRYFHSFE